VTDNNAKISRNATQLCLHTQQIPWGFDPRS